MYAPFIAKKTIFIEKNWKKKTILEFLKFSKKRPIWIL